MDIIDSIKILINGLTGIIKACEEIVQLYNEETEFPKRVCTTVDNGSVCPRWGMKGGRQWGNSECYTWVKTMPRYEAECGQYVIQLGECVEAEHRVVVKGRQAGCTDRARVLQGVCSRGSL